TPTAPTQAVPTHSMRAHAVPAQAVPGRAAPAAAGVLVILVVLMATELTFDGLVDPPAWVRAGWAITTAVAAAWLAAHGRELTTPAPPTTTRTGGALPMTGSAGAASGTMHATSGAGPATSGTRLTTSPADADPAGPARMADPLSEQDDLVQTLVMASYALQMGDEPRARQAVDGALRRSRATLDELMRQRGCHGLVRAAPAAAGRNTPNLY
ncbi:MFS transporter, partial [Parafrankia sp. Ea1.12]|uniref:MFS transporter n=1 Tax=Parafrankia sp. Ea1.12 TaxID=573499 RepID=UPI001F1AE091